MVRFLGYWGPKVCQILYRPPPKQSNTCSPKGKKTERERPTPERLRTHWQFFAFSLLTPHHSRTTLVLLAGILTSLDLSGSLCLAENTSEGCLWPRWRPCSSSQVFRFRPDLSHEQDSPHAHNSHNYNRIARERGRRVIQKMWAELLSLLPQDVSKRPRSFCLRKASGRGR